MMTKIKILIVEDNIIIAMALSRSLKNQGYAVCPFSQTAQDAMETVKHERPDLVLMDIHLGKQMTNDGIETATLIGERFRIPIAFTTAYSERETRDRAQTAQPLRYFTKPINYKELHVTIENTLQRYNEEKRNKYEGRKQLS